MLFALDLGYEESEVVNFGLKRDMIRERIQEDFVKADVYFQTLNVQTIRQEEKYSVSEELGYTYLILILDIRRI